MAEGPWAQRQRRYFDRHVASYRRMYGDETPFHAGLTGRLLELLAPAVDDEVLDLGCGVGRTTLPLLRAGCRVVGLDFSAPALAILRQRAEAEQLDDRLETRCHDARALDEEARYDRVVGRGVLHHLEDPLAVLERLRRALRPGGRALFVDPNPLQPAWIPLHTFHPALRWRDERYLLRHFAGVTRRLLCAAGFDEVQVHALGLVPPPLWARPQLARSLETRLAAVPGLRRLSLYNAVSGQVPVDRRSARRECGR